ncbi:hypothetical protein [Lutispora thermophila]|uniref:DUF8052 domain-containing protein n=1 Tax=Lutispora thermophila DSM 19022 TaxID=1122184 RepID=A0A1M6DJR9_9FIRM|nr:hypothetical protein [Lutispora thermophila]SHI73391.1 hypothetical protein SAMN02745176_01140 [Lutispora thermophila DSM 19022]
MDSLSYIGNLYDRFSIYYNTSRNVNILNESIDILAQYKDIQGRTLLTQKDIIDSFETNEICYIKKIDNMDISSLTAFTEFLKKAIDTFVQPKRDHMCTYITGVLVTECPLNEDITRFVQKFKYSKSYLFSLHGWSEIRLLVINPDIEKIIANRPGKKVIKFYKF